MPLSRDPDKRAKQLANLTQAPPPQPGSQRALTHGGYGVVNIPGLEGARREVFDWLAAAAPVRDNDGSLPAADEATVELAARALARARAVDAWLSVHGYINEKTGAVKPAAEYAERASASADRLLSKLGMNPRDRAAMLGDLTKGRTLSKQMADAAREEAQDG